MDPLTIFFIKGFDLQLVIDLSLPEGTYFGPSDEFLQWILVVIDINQDWQSFGCTFCELVSNLYLCNLLMGMFWF